MRSGYKRPFYKYIQGPRQEPTAQCPFAQQYNYERRHADTVAAQTQLVVDVVLQQNHDRLMEHFD